MTRYQVVFPMEGRRAVIVVSAKTLNGLLEAWREGIKFGGFSPRLTVHIQTLEESDPRPAMTLDQIKGAFQMAGMLN